MIRGQIEILNLPLTPKYLILPGQFLILGRGHNADVVLANDTAVSRLHCKIFAEASEFYLEDQGSRNHTLVNEEPAAKQQKRKLKNGDMIQIGHFKIRFAVVDERATETGMALPEDFLSIKRSDKLTGKIAVKLGFISREKIKECGQKQELMARDGPYYPLEEVLLQEKYLTREQLQKAEEYKRQFPFEIPNYKLSELIGMGGMGHIYRAQSKKDGSWVAIKVLGGAPKELESLIREQFRREATAMMEMNHNNIVKGIEFAETKDCSYLVMEYVDGPTLQQELKEHHGRLLSDEALDIVIQVTRALAHAHEHGLVHRDIKPENILLTRDKVVKLCDFGLVKNANGGEKEEKSFGTVAYMSPEQIRGDQNIDIRSDIYSLGAVFYRILFGKLPFVGDSQQIRQYHLNRPLTFPDEGKHFQKMELSRVIKKMMGKSADSRHQSPAVLLQELEGLRQRFAQNDSGTTEEVASTDELPRLSPKSFAVTSVSFSAHRGWARWRPCLGKIATWLAIVAVGMAVGLVLLPNRGEKAYQSFTWAVKTGDYGEAEHQAQQFLQKFPQHARSATMRAELQQIIYRKANAAYGQGKLLEAMVFCQDLLQLDASSPLATQAQKMVREIEELQARRRRQEAMQKSLASIDQCLQAKELAKAQEELGKLEISLNAEEKLAWQVRWQKWQQLSLQQSVAAYHYYPASQLGLDAEKPGKPAVSSRQQLFFAAKPVLRAPLAGIAAPFLICCGDTLHCLEAADGKVRWSLALDSADGVDMLWLAGLLPTTDVGKADRVLLMPRGSALVRMVSLASATSLWEKRLPAAPCAQPLWREQEVWLACGDHATYRLSGQTGEIIGAVRTPAPVRHLAYGLATLVRENRERTTVEIMYLGSEDGHIYGVNVRDGFLQLYLPYRARLAALSAVPFLAVVTTENDTTRVRLFREFKSTGDDIVSASGQRQPGVFHRQPPADDLCFEMPGTGGTPPLAGRDSMLCFSGQRIGVLTFSRLLADAGDPQKAWQIANLGMNVTFACWGDNEKEILLAGDKIRMYTLSEATGDWRIAWEQSAGKPVVHGSGFLPWQRAGSLYFLATRDGDKGWALVWRMLQGKGELAWQKRMGARLAQFCLPLQDRYCWFALNDGMLGQMDMKGQPLPSYRTMPGHPREDVATNFVLPPQQAKLLVVRDKGTLKTFDSTSGKPGNNWEWNERMANLGPGVAVTPYLGKLQDYVVLFSQVNVVKAVRFANGRKLDEFKADEAGDFTTAPVCQQSSVVIGNRSKLYRLQLATASPWLRKSWSFAGAGNWRGTLLHTQDEVYAGNDKGVLYSLRADKGGEIWRYASGGIITDTILMGDIAVVLGNDAGQLCALDRRTGKPMWRHNLGSAVCGKLVYDRERIYAATSAGRLVAVQAQRGSIVWDQQLATRPHMLCMVWQNRLYVADTSGFLHIVQTNL